MTVGAYPTWVTNVNGSLFFTAYSAYGVELWQSNGTNAGTVLLPGTVVKSTYPSQLTSVGGTLYYVADNDVAAVYTLGPVSAPGLAAAQGSHLALSASGLGAIAFEVGTLSTPGKPAADQAVTPHPDPPPQGGRETTGRGPPLWGRDQEQGIRGLAAVLGVRRRGRRGSDSAEIAHVLGWDDFW